MIKILAISGSLRTGSTNTTLVRAAVQAAAPEVAMTLYDGLSRLPHFNPDNEGNEDPAVLEFRRQLQSADGVFFSTPEYAHGVPGVLKNALDWVVGSGELVGKPVALLNASARSTYAQTSLTETLLVMSARFVRQASATIPLLGRNVQVAEVIADPEMVKSLRAAIAALMDAIEKPAAVITESAPVNDGKYIDSTEQLVTEIVVRDMRKSVDFYLKLGFAMLRDAGDFVELTWEDHRLFMAEQSAFQGVHELKLADVPIFPLGNVRVMVPRVDDYWKLANELGARIIAPIGDRYYGLRDFTIADPDGFGIRFATLLP